MPKILIVCLKRFDAHEKKLSNNVDFPFTFEFDQHNLTDELAKKEKNGYLTDYYDDKMEYFTANRKQVTNLVASSLHKTQSLISKINPPKKRH